MQNQAPPPLRSSPDYQAPRTISKTTTATEGTDRPTLTAAYCVLLQTRAPTASAFWVRDPPKPSLQNIPRRPLRNLLFLSLWASFVRLWHSTPTFFWFPPSFSPSHSSSSSFSSYFPATLFPHPHRHRLLCLLYFKSNTIPKHGEDATDRSDQRGRIKSRTGTKKRICRIQKKNPSSLVVSLLLLLLLSVSLSLSLSWSLSLLLFLVSLLILPCPSRVALLCLYTCYYLVIIATIMKTHYSLSQPLAPTQPLFFYDDSLIFTNTCVCPFARITCLRRYILLIITFLFLCCVQLDPAGGR